MLEIPDNCTTLYFLLSTIYKKNPNLKHKPITMVFEISKWLHAVFAKIYFRITCVSL